MLVTCLFIVLNNDPLRDKLSTRCIEIKMIRIYDMVVIADVLLLRYTDLTDLLRG